MGWARAAGDHHPSSHSAGPSHTSIASVKRNGLNQGSGLRVLRANGRPCTGAGRERGSGVGLTNASYGPRLCGVKRDALTLSWIDGNFKPLLSSQGHAV